MNQKMIFAVPSDFEKVKSIFYSHKKWFPQVRTDYMKRMIANKKLILEDGIRDSVASRGLGDVYKRQPFIIVKENKRQVMYN